jgi:hypothetical protein
MFEDGPFPPIVTVAVVLLGVGAVAVGAGGLYVTLTASDEPPDRGAEPLGEYGCEPANRDVRSVPDSGIVERTVADGSRIESVSVSDPAAGTRLNLTVEGTFLNASASRFRSGPDDPPNVTVDGSAITVTDPRRAPFRLFVDAVDDDGTVVRSEIDVCPPENPG